MVRTVSLTRFGSIARAILSTRVSPPAKCRSPTTESTFSAGSGFARDTWGRDFIYCSRKRKRWPAKVSRANPEPALNVLSVVSDLYFAGGETRVLNIARAIDPNRVKLTVLTIYAPDPEQDSLLGSMRPEFSAAGISVLNLGIRRTQGRRRPRIVQLANTAKVLGTAIIKLRQVIASQRIDVVDAHLDPSLLTAVPAAALAGVPSSITLYSELDLLGAKPGSRRRRSFQVALRRLALRLAGLVLTDSRSTATDLARFIGRPGPEVKIIPNGVHLPAPRRSRAEVLADFGIPGDTRA